MTTLANDALSVDLGYGEMEQWGIGPKHEKRTTEQLLDAIDKGNHPGGRNGSESSISIMSVCSDRPGMVGMWTLDPIDGTKGFLRGEQYAVCLALIVDSVVELGVIGCPNLPTLTKDGKQGERGAIFVAVRGQGVEEVRLSLHSPAPP